MVNGLALRVFLLLLACLSNLYCANAQAGSLSVSPIRLTLNQQDASQVVTVRNNSSKSSVIQVDALKWSQHDNQEDYTASREILATPPIFTVPPGESQIIRVGLWNVAPASIEQAFRLILQEVPPPPDPENRGLHMALRISMPVFVKPTGATTADLYWQAQSVGDNNLTISVNNTGGSHEQLSELKVYQNNAEAPLFEQKMLKYLLPETSHSWSFKSNRQVKIGATLHIEAKTETGLRKHDIVVESAQ